MLLCLLKPWKPDIFTMASINWFLRCLINVYEALLSAGTRESESFHPHEVHYQPSGQPQSLPQLKTQWGFLLHSTDDTSVCGCVWFLKDVDFPSDHQRQSMLPSKVKVIGTNTLHLLYLYTLKTQNDDMRKGSLVKDQKNQNWTVSVSRPRSAAAPCTVCYQASQRCRKPWARSQRMRTRTTENHLYLPGVAPALT